MHGAQEAVHGAQEAVHGALETDGWDQKCSEHRRGPGARSTAEADTLNHMSVCVCVEWGFRAGELPDQLAVANRCGPVRAAEADPAARLWRN
mgnify:CR=1 FL=1